MKKLNSQIALVLLFFLFVLFSCKKEPNTFLNSYENPSKNSKSYPVTDSDLKLWQNENPVAQFLALDWENAKHITIDGKPVVKVALLNESRMPVKNKQVTSTNNLKALSSFNAIFEKHPPEVYFVKNNKDSLHTYLLNFIPDDITKEFGQNNVWSGKLYEWNMNSDSLFVHEYKQNKVTNRFILKGDNTPNLNANNQIKTDSFWSWLGDVVDAIGDALNAIGYLLHIPGTDIDSSRRHPWGNERGWPSFDWFGDIFGGGGGGGGGSSSGGGGSWNTGGGSGSTGGSGTYYGGSTGGSGGSTGGSGSPDGGTPSGWSGDGGLYNEYLDDDPGYSVPVVPTYSEYLIDIFTITNPDLISFISGRSEDIGQDLAIYLKIHGETQENLDFIYWALTYLKDNPNINFEDFKNQFLYPVAITADPFADNWTDPDNSILFDPEQQTVYQEYQDNQPWPTINRVIPFEKFVSMRRDALGRQINCRILAEEQLSKAGYKVSGYLPDSQTFQCYTEASGINLSRTKQAITYTIDALQKGIPVFIAVDNRVGTPSNKNLDNSTDHFVVIVGMGTDPLKGKYFQFVDNSTTIPSYGASYNNRLYYNATTGGISGKTQSAYGRSVGFYDYKVTQIRKSIKN